MFEKLPYLPFLFQENSAERRGILGHTPSTTVLLNRTHFLVILIMM